VDDAVNQTPARSINTLIGCDANVVFIFLFGEKPEVLRPAPIVGFISGAYSTISFIAIPYWLGGNVASIPALFL